MQYGQLLPFLYGKSTFHIETDRGDFIAECIGKDELVPDVMTMPEGLSIHYQSDYCFLLSSEDKIFILIINSFNDAIILDQLKEIQDLLCEASSVIIDVRNNPGGYSYIGLELAKKFIQSPFYGPYKGEVKHSSMSYASALSLHRMKEDGINKLIAQGVIEKNELEYYKKLIKTKNVEFAEEVHEHNSTVHDCPLVILTSRNTISAAEDFVSYFKINSVGTIIGQNTNGSTGTSVFHDLPRGGKFRICCRAYRLTKDTDFINIGIKPDIKMSENIQTIAEGRDEVLEKALEYLRGIK
jgi:carboxyl-terminal processing protease